MIDRKNTVMTHILVAAMIVVNGGGGGANQQWVADEYNRILVPNAQKPLSRRYDEGMKAVLLLLL